MNKAEVYQNRDIMQYVGGGERNCCPISITPNKLYTIYEEFDVKRIKFTFDLTGFPSEKLTFSDGDT
jgi:hypothetical protein